MRYFSLHTKIYRKGESATDIILHSVKFENNFCYEISPVQRELAVAFRAIGYSVEYRYKKLLADNREYEVAYPIVTNRETEGKIVILPEFVSPHRPYPIYVYIFAVGIYELNPGIPQRAVASLTRKQFGLETFSHSTVCRVRKHFQEIVRDMLPAISAITNGRQRGVECADGSNGPAACGAHDPGHEGQTIPQPTLAFVFRGFPGLNGLSARQKQSVTGHSWFFTRVAPEDSKRFMEAANRFCRRFFSLTQRLLI